MDPRAATSSELDRFRSLRGSDLPEGMFIGDGERVVRRMLQAGVARSILSVRERLGQFDVPPEVEVLLADEEQIKTVVGYRLHAGVMALGAIPPEKPIAGTLHVALDRIANAENVGAILRTCAAFGVDGVIFGPDTSSPWLRRTVRVSMGAPLVVPVHRSDDLAATLAPMNAWAAHIHGDKRDFLDVDYRKPVCLVLGGEAEGVSERVLAACRGILYVPMAAAWDCLNVAACTAVLLAEVARQRR